MLARSTRLALISVAIAALLPACRTPETSAALDAAAPPSPQRAAIDSACGTCHTSTAGLHVGDAKLADWAAKTRAIDLCFAAHPQPADQVNSCLRQGTGWIEADAFGFYRAEVRDDEMTNLLTAAGVEPADIMTVQSFFMPLTGFVSNVFGSHAAWQTEKDWLLQAFPATPAATQISSP